MCIHLKEMETYLRSQGAKETWRGQPWTERCREWIYFDCVLNIESLQKKVLLDDCVTVHDYNDIKAGAELGFFCNQCEDAIMGIHPATSSAANKQFIS